MPIAKRTPDEKPPEVAPARFTGAGALLGKRASRPAAPMDAAAPTVVVLPPRLKETADSSVRADADLACDRLAEELAAEGIARIVDRSQVDRVLEEKRLAGDWTKPIVGFDALLRLEVNVPSIVPEVRLSLIDVSHGNVMKEERCAWPLREDDLHRMVGQCREGLRQVGWSEKGQLKVRWLEAENEEQNPRIEPLVRRLEGVLEQAVARSPQLVAVQHLEAASAKEESLLLLMGLSRLPGGRQFVPKADATIQLRVREGDGQGKSFDQTPVEIMVRVIRGDAGGDQSFAIDATVARFDAAATETWEKLAGLLREARPDAAANWLDDLAARRRQAEAELRAARSIDRGHWGTAAYEQATHARLAHIEAALKLDPTLEDAYGELMASLNEECSLARMNRERRKMADVAESTLAQALQYLDRFGPHAKYRRAAHDACSLAIYLSLDDLDTSSRPELTSQRLRMVQMAKRILDDAMRYSDLGTSTMPFGSTGTSSVSRP